MSLFLEAKGLTKKYSDKVIINNLDITVAKSDILGLLGTNGAGKTTTIKILTGNLRPDYGTVLIDNNNVFEDRLKACKNLGYLPEGAPIWENISVIDTLLYCAGNYGISKKNFFSDLQDLSYVTNIKDFLFDKVETLSKGQRRRMSLAISLIHDPSLLILDEPSDGLDPIQKEHLYKVLKKISKNKAILMTSHDLLEVANLCTKIIIITEGQIYLKIDKKISHKELVKIFNKAHGYKSN